MAASPPGSWHKRDLTGTWWHDADRARLVAWVRSRDERHRPGRSNPTAAFASDRGYGAAVPASFRPDRGPRPC